MLKALKKGGPYIVAITEQLQDQFDKDSDGSNTDSDDHQYNMEDMLIKDKNYDFD